jgi:hypothetical protein
VLEVDAGLELLASELQQEADAVAEVWSKRIAEQAIALGPLFDARQYPTADFVRHAYSLDWNYVRFDAPENLESVDSAMLHKAEKKFEKKLGEAYTEVRVVMRETLQQVTNELVERLTPAADGKPKSIRGTVLRDLLDFLHTYDLRDLTDDKELQRVVSTLRKLTSGVSPEQLKDNEGLKTSLVAQVQAAASQLDALVETGRRGMRFGGGLSDVA